MSDLVSIIITTYNRADLIIQTVQCCLNQTYRCFEIIIIDDGSTDGTKQVLTPFIESGQIQYYYQNNSERAIARNTGAKKAKGIYLKFLDSDDLVEKDYLEKSISHFQANKNCEVIYTNIKSLNEDVIKLTARKKSIRNMYKYLWEENDIALSSVIISKTSFFKYGSFDETRKLSGAEDWEFWVRSSKQGCNFSLLKDYLTIIRSHHFNGTMNDVNKIIYSGNIAVCLLLQKFPDIKKKDVRRFQARMFFLRAIYYNTAGNKIYSFYAIIKALILNPSLCLKIKTLFMFGKLIIPESVVDKLHRRNKLLLK